MQQPEAGVMRPILAGYLCDDDRERKKKQKVGIYEACTSGCLYVIAFAPCWKLKLPLWGITAEGFFHQQSSALHTPPIAHRPDAFSFASPWNGTLFWGFCTCLKVIRAPFHTWRGPPRWGGMLKQMQQPLKTDSPDLLMLLLCAHTQMCRDVCVGCVCVCCQHMMCLRKGLPTMLLDSTVEKKFVLFTYFDEALMQHACTEQLIAQTPSGLLPHLQILL